MCSDEENKSYLDRRTSSMETQYLNKEILPWMIDSFGFCNTYPVPMQAMVPIIIAIISHTSENLYYEENYHDQSREKFHRHLQFRMVLMFELVLFSHQASSFHLCGKDILLEMKISRGEKTILRWWFSIYSSVIFIWFVMTIYSIGFSVTEERFFQFNIFFID